MATKYVSAAEFHEVVDAIPRERLMTGNDVGRTHGITCYYDSGKLVGTSRWFKDFTNCKRTWKYELEVACSTSG